ncbi:Uncharacterised protein [uncultured archaeon]|nr:Uncharacterised protein [uncultured archaeon]
MALEVDVAEVRQSHDAVHRFLELELLQVQDDLIHGLLNPGIDLGIDHSSRNLSLEVLGGKGQRPIDEVAKGSHQLCVHLLGKDLPGEVHLLVVSGVAGQVIAQQIGMQALLQVVILHPDDIPPGFGELLVVDLQHAAGHNRGRQGIVGSFEHGRPEDAVMVDYVSADEMDDPGFVPPIISPILAILGAPLLSEGDVSDGRIHPNVNHQFVVTWELHAPAHVPGYAPILQLLADPLMSVVSDRCRPVQCLQVPEQEVLELGELEEVMNLLAVLGSSAADFADGVLDLSRLQVAAAAHVALVAAG